MKIAFIGGRDIHKLGGIETYMMNLCTKLVALGYEPIVYCESDENREETINGFKVIHWKAPKSVFVCKIWLGLKSTLNALCSQKGIEVFHYNAWPPSLWNWIPRMCGKTALMMGHGLEWKRTKYSSRGQMVMKFMEMLTAHMNNHLLMCSQEQTDYFAKHYGRICVTITTAVNMPDPEKVSDKFLEKYSLERDSYFLYLGRLVQDKNPDYLIRAFNESKIDSLKLVVAGANEADKKYVESLHKLGADNPNVVFTDAVYGEDKECLLKNCRAFCIPSTIEGLAITLLEAMSYGKPVIASDIEANKEGLGEEALWVKTENVESLKRQLLACVDNAGILRNLGARNKQRVVESFTWDAIAAKYIDYLKSIC